jgi:hypothetical protein
MVMTHSAGSRLLLGGFLVASLSLWGGTAAAQDLTAPPAVSASVSVSTPAPASVSAPMEGGQVRNGFSIGASLVLKPGYGLVIGSGSSSTGVSESASLGGGISLGYKIDRIRVYLGFDYGVLTSSAGNGSSSSTSDSAFSIAPGIQFAFLRSADKRAELFGDFQIGGGAVINTQSNGGTSVTTTNSLLVYELAPGVRYWVSPNIAVQAMVGFGGEVVFGANNSGTVGVHGLAANAGLVSAF